MSQTCVKQCPYNPQKCDEIFHVLYLLRRNIRMRFNQTLLIQNISINYTSLIFLTSGKIIIKIFIWPSKDDFTMILWIIYWVDDIPILLLFFLQCFLLLINTIGTKAILKPTHFYFAVSNIIFLVQPRYGARFRYI